ncbi:MULTISPECIES: thiol reductant ABC exporter subunit CydC [Cobetia]|uniref:thiol reductant ABC exporter subunit CydC n=1 Tax=Cobetia TaxID=204286 RepID=UPI000694D720|nr:MULTISPECIES: thiol reductant ABC exporter subunit CydC [Cobetia]MBR9797518.1 thiol reductant ABC exporter subunit CydC [Gammaproteobacteria bacterium]BBO55197.1 cysteine/glutathione ABC transporter ATP-binding protein/permease CydC [Cobetia sp. AM6]
MSRAIRKPAPDTPAAVTSASGTSAPDTPAAVTASEPALAESHAEQRPRLRELAPYLALMREHRGWLGIGALLALITLLAATGLLALSGWFLSATAVAGLSVAATQAFNFFTPAAGVRGLALARTAGRYGERVTTHEGTLRLLASLRRRLFEAIEPLSPAALQQAGQGELMTRLGADVDALDSLYVRVLIPSLVAICAILAAGTLIGIFAPTLALVAVIGLVLTGGLVPWLAWWRGSRDAIRHQSSASRLRARLLERLQGLGELVIYGRWNEELERLAEQQAERDRIERAQARRQALASWLSHSLLGLTLAGVALLGVMQMAPYANNDMTMLSGELLDGRLLALFLLAVLGAFEALAPLPLAWQGLGRCLSAAARLNSVQANTPAAQFPSDCEAATPVGHALEIEQLSVTHGDTPVLEELSLTLAAGEHLALLGPSGSGKSTLLDVLSRFHIPSAGHITLGGVALESLDEATLRASFAVCPQDTHLFCASYADNLRLAAPEASDEALTRMLESLGLGDWLARQPQGLAGFPDEGGRSLSGGQLRRFGVARALLSPAPIVLLDEPCEGLDRTSAEQVMSAILAACEGRSLIMITHQPLGLERFARLALLEAGRLQEDATPTTLSSDSRLARLMERTA